MTQPYVAFLHYAKRLRDELEFNKPYYVRLIVTQRFDYVAEGEDQGIPYTAEGVQAVNYGEIYGVTDIVYPSPPKYVLIDNVKYSGYDSVDEWIDDFCHRLPHFVFTTQSWLCLHHGNVNKYRGRSQHKVFLIRVLVDKVRGKYKVMQ